MTRRNEAIAESRPGQLSFGAAGAQLNTTSSQPSPQALTPLMTEAPTRMQAAVTDSLHLDSFLIRDIGGLLFCRVGAFWLQANEAG